MNCDRFDDLVMDLGRAVPMDAALRQEATRHAAGCSRCSAALAREAALAKALAAWAAEPAEPSAALEESVLGAFDRHHRRAPVRLAWIAAAACLALIGGAATWMAMRPKPAQVALAPAPAPGEPQAVQPAPVVVVQAPAPAKPPVRRAARRPRTVQQPEKPEPETDFVPLPFVEPLLPRERARVFRVSMPRGALAGFGLPVNPEEAFESIRADLVVGEDNVARAIRFVPRNPSSSNLRRIQYDQ